MNATTEEPSDAASILLHLANFLPAPIPISILSVFIPPLFVFLLLILVSELLRDHTPSGKPDDAPYLPTLPFAGHFYRHGMDKMVVHGTETEGMVKLGKVLKLFMPGLRSINVFDPAVIKRMLITDFKIFDRNTKIGEIFDALAGGLALMPNGERWKQTRTFFGPFFHTAVVKGYSDIINRNNDKLHVYLKDLIKKNEAETASKGLKPTQPTIDFQPLYDAMNFDIITTLICGHNPDSITGDRHLINAFCEAIAHGFWRFIVRPSRYWVVFKTPEVRRHERNMRDLQNLVLDRLKGYEENGVEDRDRCVLAEFVRRKNRMLAKGKDGTDVADNNSEETIPPFLLHSKKELVKHLMTFLFAGRDTTAALLTWGTAYIALYPHVQNSLYAEISQAPQPFTYEQLDRLPYLDAVIKETLRLRPPLPVLFRQPTEDVVLEWKKPDGSLGRQFVGKGQNIMWNSLGVHTHPDHFSNPTEFLPERWLKNNNNSSSSPSPTPSTTTYLPFGAGPRRCVGEKLALFQAKFIVADLVRRWEVEPGDGFDMEIEHAVTMRAKKGVRVRLIERKGARGDR